MRSKQIVPVLVFAGVMASAVAMAQGPQSQSPASRPRTKPATTETYTPDQIRTGEQRFAAQCGFCHGRDASGGESGPDLTRSEVVVSDVRGNKLDPFLRAKRPEGDMPTFELNPGELTAINAFLHSQIEKFAKLGGGRGAVAPEDLTTGNAADGRAYFKDALSHGKAGAGAAESDLYLSLGPNDHRAARRRR
jgi:cytochrome c oxidase cbb3-type subunit 3